MADSPPPPDSAYDLAPEEGPSGNTRLKPVKKVAVPAKEAPSPKSGASTERKCPYCGFTFLGQPKARCPDCSSPLDIGTADLLEFAAPSWVRSLVPGMGLIVVGIVGHVIGAVFRMLNVQPVKGVVHAGAAVVVVLGVFIATRVPQDAKSGGGMEKWSRVLAIVALVLWLWLGAVAVGMVGVNRLTVQLPLLIVLAVQAALAFLVGQVLAELAARIPDDSLGNHCRQAGGMMGVVCLSLLLLKALELDNGDYLKFFMCSFPMAAGLLVLNGWAIITLLRMGGTLRTVARAGTVIAARRKERMAARKG